MPQNQEAHRRYKIIDACITNKYKKYPSMDELIQKCEDILDHKFNVSTIQKDIEIMKRKDDSGFSAPIKFSRKYNGYYYSNPDYKLYSAPLNDSDIEALKAAMDFLSGFGGARVSNNFNHAVEKILTTFKEHFPDGNPGRKIIQTDAPTDGKAFEHFDFFFGAAKNKIAASFVHYSYNKQTFSSVILHPVLLKEFQNYWYVLGYSENHRGLRIFGLDRVYDPILLNKKFIDTNPTIRDEYFKNVYGVFPYSNRKKQKIIFRVKPMLGNYLLTHPLHPSQKVLHYGDFGYLDLSLDLIPSIELTNYFLEFSTQLKVLKPEWIKNEIHEAHAIALKYEKAE